MLEANALREKNRAKCSQNIQKVSEYDQEIPQSQIADQPRHREEKPQNIYIIKASERK